MAGRFIAQLAEKAGVQVAEAGEQGAEAISSKLLGKVADTEEQNLGESLETEAKNTDGFENEMSKLEGNSDPEVGSVQSTTRTTGAGVPKDVAYYEFSDDELEAAGITSKGADDVETGGTDPVDLVSGQLIASTTDLVRLGVLPLIVRRAYTSGYAHGALLGPGWAGTLDVRLLVDQDGIRFLGDNAQILDYGIPASLGLGLPATASHGARWPLYRDRECYRVEQTDAGLSWIFPSEADGTVRPLAEIRDRNGNRITVLRDEAGVPTELAHSGGYGVRVRTLETPGGTRVADLSLRTGDDGPSTVLVEYGYDDAGRLVTITDSSGVPYLYEWNDRDRICGGVDCNGHDYHYAYDTDGRVVRAWGAGGYLTSQIAYDRAGRVTSVADGAGHTTAYHYNRFQQVVRIVDPLGGELLIDRDRYGHVLSSTDQLGNTAHAERDAAGLAVRITAPNGAETAIAYSGPGLPVRMVEPNGAVWGFEYDRSGNLSRRVDPLGAATSYAYDERGALRAVTDPLGATTVFEVDDAGLATRVVGPLGAVWQMQRDVFGRVVALTDPAGAIQRSDFSPEGLLLGSQDAAGSVRYSYDPGGNLVKRVDAAGAVTRFEYGPMGLRTASIDALGQRHRFAYDSELRLTGVTGPTGLEWTYAYDAAGRLIGERDFDGHELTYRLDAAGRLIERVNAAGEVTGLEYDAAGHLIRRVAGGIEQRFAYDTTGQMVRAESPGAVLAFTRDLRGRPTAESLNGRTLTRTYDPAGNQVRTTTPSGASTQWSFDAAGNATALATAGGVLEFERDILGRETARRLGPDVSIDRRYDPASRMTGLRVTACEQLLQERTYAYRADGTVEQLTDRLRGTSRYTLDALGRATAMHTRQWSATYAYDELGTLAAAATGTGTGADESGPRAIVGTQIRQDGRTGYTYDAEGRLTGKTRRTLSGRALKWTYTWDTLGHLIRAETPDRGTWAYSYDPLGRRSAKTLLDADDNAAASTVFTYDGPRLVEETAVDPRNAQTSVTTWNYEPSSFVPAAQSRRLTRGEPSGAFIDEQFHAIVTDLVGTPTDLVTADGAVLPLAARDLWGRGRPRTGHDGPDPCPLRFPGQYADTETGLHYNLHRYYDPDLAAYLSPDPLGLPPSPNPRSYIGNPLTESDPLGLNGESGPDKPVPGPNLSNASRVPYGQDPMSNLAITARKNLDPGMTSGKNVAVYLYHDADGGARGIAIQSDVTHSERLGWSTLNGKIGIGKDQIDSIYTELQPCGKIYHDCDKWLSTNMDGVPVSYSFDYGPDRAGQTAGMNALRRALTQVRQGNLPK